jgi:hypothetical protein
MFKTTLSLLAASAVALTATTALAQARRPDAEPKHVERDVKVYRFDRHGGHHPHVMAFRGGEGRADHLRTVLQLRPEQEGALKAFVEATRPDRSRDHLVRFDREAARSTPERLAEMEAKLAEQQQAMRGRIAATRAFYDQLDAKQKADFDAMPMLMMVGPGLGPMMIPGPMKIMHHRGMPAPAPAPTPDA